MKNWFIVGMIGTYFMAAQSAYAAPSLWEIARQMDGLGVIKIVLGAVLAIIATGIISRVGAWLLAIFGCGPGAKCCSSAGDLGMLAIFICTAGVVLKEFWNFIFT